jgi:hypothetical protein
MNAEQESCSDWDESSTICEIDANFGDTFCQNPEDSKLQVTRFLADDDGNGKLGYSIHPNPIAFSDDVEFFAVCLHLAKLILSFAHTSKEQPDLCQIFGIYQKNSYSRLYITRELFERFIRAYSIFSCIWEFVLPFHFQLQEDIGHAPFRFRRLGADLDKNPNAKSFGGEFLSCFFDVS